MNFVEQKRPDLQTRTEVTWTDDRVELLKRLWAEGLSASQIAGELGGITRNAVIGKVHRLGLSGRAKAPSSSVPRPRKPRTTSQMFRPSRPMVRGNTALATVQAYDYDPEPEIEPIENIIPLGQRCSLLELNDEKCHWPIGDPASRISSSAAARPPPARRIAAITAASPISRRQPGVIAGRHGVDWAYAVLPNRSSNE